MTADDPIYMALGGTDDDPAVAGQPRRGRRPVHDERRVHRLGGGVAGSWPGHLSCRRVASPTRTATSGSSSRTTKARPGEFDRNLDFAVNVAESATDPDDPASHFGSDTSGLYLNVASLDPWKTNWTQADLRVDVSYAGGSSQPVEVLAKRASGPGHAQLPDQRGGHPNRGCHPVTRATSTVATTPTTSTTTTSARSPRPGGRRLGRVLVHRRRRGHRARHVRGRGRRHRRRLDPRRGGLHRSLGGSRRTRAPPMTRPTTSRLHRRDRRFRTHVRVYDVDAMGRTAPDYLGVLLTTTRWCGTGATTSTSENRDGAASTCHGSR